MIAISYYSNSSTSTIARDKQIITAVDNSSFLTKLMVSGTAALMLVSSVLELTDSASTVVASGIKNLYTNHPASIKENDNFSELRKLLQEAPWTKDFFKNARHLDKAKQLLPYYESINKLLFDKRFDTCDRFFSLIDVSNLSDVLLIGILRLTVMWKDNFKNWDVLLHDAKKQLDLRGLDSTRLLRGLLE